MNCNICESNSVCIPPLVPSLPENYTHGICKSQTLPILANYMQCDVTNKEIVKKMSEERRGKAEITFSLNNELQTASFQFWADSKESFYCKLWNCSPKSCILI